MGCLNVRGCGNEAKRCEIGGIMNDSGLDVLALSETKLKGKGEEVFGSVKGLKSGVGVRFRAREGVAVLLSEDMWKCVTEHKEESPRLMWVRLKLGSERWVIVSVYAPYESGTNGIEVERFWDELRGCLEKFGNSERVIVLGDLNARVGDRPVQGVLGSFGVQGVNGNGETLVQLCVENELVIGNTWFKKRDVHKYTWERMGGDDKALMDYVLVRKRDKSSMTDVNVFRGAARGVSDHYLVVCKMKLRGKVYMRRVNAPEKMVTRVSELAKDECKRRYGERISYEWARVKDLESQGVDEEWMRLRDVVCNVGREVCGTRKVGGKKRKGCEWWNDEVKRLIGEKGKLFNRWLKDKNGVVREEYKRKNREVKAKVRELKERADERWSERVSACFRENKKMFWKEVNGVRKDKEQKVNRVKDENGVILNDKEECEARWSEYFENLLNVQDEREADVMCIGRGDIVSDRVSELEKISVDEVKRAVKKMKGGKATGLDEVYAEFLKEGGASMIEWLTRVFNVCMEEGEVPDDWKGACIVPLYKGKGDRLACASYRGISLLSIPGKVYGRVIIQRVIDRTKGQVSGEQSGFMEGRGCVDQIFALRDVCEKYLEKNKSVYLAFMDLEKAYDRVDREALWKVLRMYGVGGKLLGAVKSFYVGSRACVRWGRETGEWFPVSVGLRQGCVMSPWLFNVFMDGVVREVKACMLERGAKMVNERTGNVWEVGQLLYADDATLVADSEEKLQRMVREFGRVCEKRKLKVNVRKSKIMLCSAHERRDVSIDLKGEKLEQVNDFVYLGAKLSEDGLIGTEVNSRIDEGMKHLGALKSVWNRRGMTVQSKMGMYEAIISPVVLYASETWKLNAKERKKVDVFDMKCLRAVSGVRRVDRVRNERIRERCGSKKSMLGRADESVLRWYGHVERMDNERVTKKIYESSVSGVRGRGKPKLRWMDCVKELVERRGLTLQAAKECVKDRVRWRRWYKGGDGHQD